MVQQEKPTAMNENKDIKTFEEILKRLEVISEKLNEQKETNKQIFERIKKLETNINKTVKRQK